MPGGKAVIVNRTKQERATRRAAEEQMGALGPRSDTGSRWRFLAGSLTGQDSMAC